MEGSKIRLHLPNTNGDDRVRSGSSELIHVYKVKHNY